MVAAPCGSAMPPKEPIHSGPREYQVLPRHLLEDALYADPAAFPSNPYFYDTSVFVGSGPYRPTEWERGSHLTLEAFDGYYFGRPRIDRVVLRIIPDSRTALATMLAGEADMAFRGMGYNEAVVLRDEWAKSNGGAVVFQPIQYASLVAQFRPEVVSPRDLLNRDVRKALLHALDRAQLAEAAFPGAAIVPDSTAFPGTELHRAVEQRVVKYAYDPSQTARMLADAGWTRGGDGMLAKGGERFQVEIVGSPTGHAADVFPVLQQHLKQAGMDTTFKPVERDRQAQISFRSFQNTGHLVNSVRATPALLSSQIPTPENRFGGANDGGYNNPAYDQAVAALNRALRPADYYRAWGDLYQIVSEDLPMLPLYFTVQPNAVRRGVSGALPTSPVGHGAHRIHEWDVARG